MIRFFFRLLSALALSVAVIMAVVDATRSVAVDGLVLTPLATSWAAVSPDSFALARTTAEHHISAALWDPVALAILSLPGFVVFLLLSLLLYAIGHRPARHRGFGTLAS